MSNFSNHLIAGLPGVAYRLGRDAAGWALLEIGEQVVDLTGYTARECIERQLLLRDLVLPEDVDYVHETVRQALADCGDYSLEYRAETRAGKRIYLWERGRGIYDENGDLQEIVGFIFDSSHHQQQLQRIREFQGAVLNLARSENLGRGNVEVYARECLTTVAEVMSIDRGSVWTLNASKGVLRRLCLYVVANDHFSSGETLLVKEYPAFLEPLSRGRALDVYDAQQDPRTSEGEVGQYISHHDVKSLLAVPVRRGGEVIGLITLEQQGVKRRWANDEISLTNELADLLQQSVSNRELHLTQSRLLEAEAASAAKKNFLGIVSHELRTPLNGVLGVAELLSMTNLDEKQREYVGNIEQSGRHLLDVITAVIDLANLQEGSLQLEASPCDLQDLLQECHRVLANSAAEKSLQLRLDIGQGVPAQLLLDARRLTQIVLGLMSNAIQYTSQGEVRLSAESLSRNGEDYLRIVVADTGPGIEPELQPQIFTPFVQQRELKTGRSLRGVGLSLAICRQLSILMGGELTFETEQGQGTEFVLELPLQADESDEALSGDIVESKVSTIKTLIVEDDRVNQKVAVGLLKKFGISADLCVDGSQAVERIQGSAEPYDLVLMDCEMPVMDGFEATRAIRQLPEPKNVTYIAALTAHAVDDYRSRAMAAGMNDFLTKPLTPSRLKKLLSGLVARMD